MGMVHPICNQHLERHHDNYINIGLASMQGYRNEMEDHHTIVLSSGKHQHEAFCAIFDGHAGEACSKWCSEHVWQYLMNHTDNVDTIQTQCVQADQDFMEQTKSRSTFEHYDKSGSTAMMASLIPDGLGNCHVKIINIGDSRAIWCKANGDMICLTKDHRPNSFEERQRIFEAGGFIKENRVDGNLAISRAFGDRTFKSNVHLDAYHQKVIAVPDVTSALLQPGDFLLLYCDGIVEQMSDEQAVSIVREWATQTNDLAMIMSELLKAALKSGSKDNMSAMLITLSSTPNYEKHNDVRYWPAAFHSCDPVFVNAYTADAKRRGYTLSQALALLPTHTQHPI